MSNKGKHWKCNEWRVRPFVHRIQEKYGRHPSDLIGALRYEGYRWIDIAKILETSQSTIHRYIRKIDLGYLNVTEAGREVKRQTARKLNDRMARGEVQRGGFASIPLEYVLPDRPYDTASRL